VKKTSWRARRGVMRDTRGVRYRPHEPLDMMGNRGRRRPKESQPNRYCRAQLPGARPMECGIGPDTGRSQKKPRSVVGVHDREENHRKNPRTTSRKSLRKIGSFDFQSRESTSDYIGEKAGNFQPERFTSRPLFGGNGSRPAGGRVKCKKTGVLNLS